MKYFVTQFLLIILSVVVADIPAPPADGKFFYLEYTSPHVADYTTDQPDLIQTGQHFIPALISNANTTNNQKMNLGLSTQMQEIVLFNSGYDTCHVPHPYDKALSKTVNETSTDTIVADILVERNTYRVQNTTATGNSYADQFKFEITEYQREVVLNLTFFGVYKCDPEVTTAYDGFIGIKQYQADYAAFSSWKYNIMWQLKHPDPDSGFEAMIDNMVVQVYSRRGQTGIIKVGGWDQNALLAGQTLQMMKTFDMNSWSVECSKISFDDEIIFSNTTDQHGIVGPMKYIEFAPDLPYLYIPLNDFSHWEFYLASDIYTEASGHKLECDPDVDGSGTSYCRFQQQCSELPLKILKMTLTDADGSPYVMQTKSTEFFVDGENFGHKKDQYCYIPAFRYGLANPTDREINTWFAGTLVWSSYTVVFDNTPHDNDNHGYSAIGLGVINPTSSGIAAQYQQSYASDVATADWKPVNEALDMSHHIGAWEFGPLVAPIIVPPQVIPKPPTPPAPPSFLEKYWYFVAAGAVALMLCMWCTYRCCTYKSPKTYYNAMYSIAQDNPMKIRIQ